MHQGHAEDVGGGKEPASAAASLVGDGCALEGDLDVEYLLVDNLGRAGRQDISRVRGGKGRESKSGCRVPLSKTCVAATGKRREKVPVLGVLQQLGLPVLQLSNVERRGREPQGAQGLLVEACVSFGFCPIDLDEPVVVELALALELEGPQACDDGALGRRWLGLIGSHGSGGLIARKHNAMSKASTIYRRHNGGKPASRTLKDKEMRGRSSKGGAYRGVMPRDAEITHTMIPGTSLLWYYLTWV